MITHHTARLLPTLAERPLVAVGHSLVSISLPSRALVTAVNRPCPPPLPREQQHEFEHLQRTAQMPLSSPSSSHAEAEAELALHPDARKPLKPDFDGHINPQTGEQDGPKTEPVRKWVQEDNGDWSFKGRVSDF